MKKGMRKMLSLFIAVSMAVIPTFAFAAGSVPGNVYSDETSLSKSLDKSQIQEIFETGGVVDIDEDNWAAGAVAAVLQLGLMSPDEEGNFNPAGEVSNQAGAAVFAKILGLVPMDASEEEAVEAMQDAGLIDEDIDEEEGMTRLQSAWLVAKSLGMPEVVWIDLRTYPYTDTDDLTQKNQAMLQWLYKKGAYIGYGDGTFRPHRIITRAELATLVDRILGAIGALEE